MSIAVVAPAYFVHNRRRSASVPAGRGKKYYYYRAVAESSGSPVYGETMTFVTP